MAPDISHISVPAKNLRPLSAIHHHAHLHMHIGVYRTQRAEVNMRNIRSHLVNSLFDSKLANPGEKGYLEASHRRLGYPQKGIRKTVRQKDHKYSGRPLAGSDNKS